MSQKEKDRKESLLRILNSAQHRVFSAEKAAKRAVILLNGRYQALKRAEIGLVGARQAFFDCAS